MKGYTERETIHEPQLVSRDCQINGNNLQLRLFSGSHCVNYILPVKVSFAPLFATMTVRT